MSIYLEVLQYMKDRGKRNEDQDRIMMNGRRVDGARKKDERGLKIGGLEARRVEESDG
jgi:hypothetical protein